MGVNRVSLGVQSFDIEVLKKCSRNQNIENIYNALELLNNENINISIDLINGLPLTNPMEEIKNLANILGKYSNVNHISFYELSIDKSSKFYKIDNLKLPEEEIKAVYEYELKKLLKKYNFKRYEISNYAKKGFESKHNLNYWKYRNYIGLGPAAHSTIDKFRIENKSDIDVYITGNNYRKINELSIIEQIEEYLLMGLRLIDGIILEDFSNRFDISFNDFFCKTIYKYKKLFIYDVNGNRIKLNSRGLNILNKILIDLFFEIDNNINPH